MDALILVIRIFEDDEVPHVQGSVDPKRDLEELKTDFILADLGIVEHRIEKLNVLVKRPSKTQEADRAELAFMEKLKVLLEEGRPLKEFGFRDEERKLVTGYRFITLLPYLVLHNMGEEDLPLSVEESPEKPGVVRMCGKVEMELSELPEGEREIFSSEMGVEELASERIIRACYALLDLITFFTANEKEARAWAIERGATAVEAAGKVHTDMARGFIRAEVINFADLVELGSVREVKAKGKARLEGKGHLVEDGDLIEFRFSR
jgi:GTP-binding protein YchF